MKPAAIAASAVAFGAALVGAWASAKELPLDPPRIVTLDATAEKAWAGRYLDQDDWILTSFANDEFWLVSSEETGHNAYPKVLDWIRFEDGRPLVPSQPSGSALWQVEVDCATSGYRPIRLINYRYNNLRGAVLSDHGAADAKLTTAAPGTVIGSALAPICKSAAENAPAKP